MLLTYLFFAFLLHVGSSDEKCSTKIDLQIIVDSSASVTEKHFHTMMKGISRSLIDQFDIGEDKTRVALFKYSRKSVMVEEFLLNTFTEKKALEKRIEETEFERGFTMTAMAMKLALNSFKKQQNEKSAKVCLVFTDGEATDADDVPAASKSWAADGVTVFAIGIGDGISREGLEAIAGEKDRAIVLQDFSSIAARAKDLLKDICNTVGKEEKLVEVDFKFGKSGATSIHAANHNSDRAFVSQTKGTYPWANAQGKLPAIVWNKLPSEIKVGRISFSSRIDCCLIQSPTEFELVGSNDCKNWITIVSIKTKFSKLSEVQSWDIPKEKRQPFSCVGIKSVKVISGPWVAIQNLRMWQEPEYFAEVDWKIGKSGATSIHAANHNSDRAFVSQTKGTYPWANAQGKLPAIVWNKLPSKIKVGRISFSSRIDCCLIQSPTEFELVGSNDCVNWITIVSIKTKFSKLSEVQSWDIPKEKRQPFSCVGIKSVKVISGPWVAIENLRMWKDPEYLAEVDWKKGKSGATSIHAANHNSDRAFMVQTKGTYPWANTQGKLPAIVWNKMPSEIKVGKFSFSSRIDCCLEQSPIEFELVGSNDCKNWKTIVSIKTKFSKLSEVQSWDVPKEKIQSFSCIGIKSEKGSSGPWVAIQSLRMWQE